MVGTLANSSSKKASAQKIISQVLASGLLARNQKARGNKGASIALQTERDSSEDLSDISDAEVAGYLNNKKEYLVKKILWEGMNRNYQKGRQRKDTSRKKKAAPANKTDPAKKTMTNTTTSTATTENKKRLSSKINYEALEKLFESEGSPKRTKLEKPEAARDLEEDSQQAGEENLPESRNLDKGTEMTKFGKTDEFCSENYDNRDVYGDEETYGGVHLEDQDGEDYDDYNNFDDEEFF